MKFRKKPVVIEAVRYTGSNMDDISALTGFSFIAEMGLAPKRWLIIETLEGKMKATEGDWIIKGVAGEFYPCKPDIFEATYEAVE